ncbi:hypothetical protein HaLaN_08545, partial [Haematococcus lacustris]
AEALPGILAAAVVQLARLGQVGLLQQLLLHCKGDQLYGLGPWALQRTIQQAGALDSRCSAGMGWGVPPGEVLLEAGLPALRATAAAGHAAAASLLLLWGADPHHQAEALPGILAAALVQLARLGQVGLLQQLLLHCKGDQLYGLGPWALQRTIQQAGALDSRCSAGMGWGVPPG